MSVALSERFSLQTKRYNGNKLLGKCRYTSYRNLERQLNAEMRANTSQHKARPYQINFMFHGSGRVFFLKIEIKKSKNAINMYT